jgi:hypothetical protein
MILFFEISYEFFRSYSEKGTVFTFLTIALLRCIEAWS